MRQLTLLFIPYFALRSKGILGCNFLREYFIALNLPAWGGVKAMGQYSDSDIYCIKFDP
jgi:hypothetical protein